MIFFFFQIAKEELEFYHTTSEAHHGFNSHKAEKVTFHKTHLKYRVS